MARPVSRFILLIALVVTAAACSKRPEISVDRGKELYMAYGCAACHGVDGDGKGPAAGLSKIPPRNLRDLSSYVLGTSANDITRSIEVGMKATGMPAYVELPHDERMSMALWIISIAEETKK